MLVVEFVKHDAFRESSQVRQSPTFWFLKAPGWGLAIQKIKLACGVRSVCQRLSAADVSDRVAAGAQEWRGRPLFAYVRENRAGVYAFASMADKCVS